ncbi:glutamate receptor 3 [Parasteatoda tepidariorum]|uniref:glutamate receptor 3 n=1 Tax=Parasteatoda tepidariorum TaxID=114398 RepID=UPI00077FA223|nr:glutamate receptor U1 [Parasteatoda tepidariorum]
MNWTSFFLLCPLLVLAHRVKIGRVSGPGDDDRLTTEEFWSYSPNSATSLILEPVTHKIQWWTTLDATVAVCKLAERGVRALVMDGPPRLSPLLATYSKHMQMPSIGGTVNVLPDANEAAAFFIQQWKTFAFIYTTETGPDQLQKILRLLDFTPRVEAFWRTNGAKETLEFAKSLPNVPLVISSSESFVDELLSYLAILRRSFDIMLLTPVGSVRKKLHPGSYRLIQFSFVDQDSPTLKGFENRWKTIRRSSNTDKELPDSAILNHEASTVFQNLFNEQRSSDFSGQKFDCFNYSAGISPNDLQNVFVSDGLSGEIKFDSEGRRKDYKLNIYEERPVDLRKIGWWSANEGVQLSEKHMQMSPTSAAQQDERATHFRVTSIINKPFLFESSDGNLQGFIIDFLEELKTVLRISYTLNLVKDGKYGMVNPDGTWNGMIGELLRGEADMIVSDLTKTKFREAVVDYSKPFMTFGLNILMKKPDNIQHERSSFSPFSFLKVWSAETWTVVILSLLVLSGTCYLISRYVAPPDRVRALESKGTDNLSPCGSLWFTCSSLLLRDTGIYPRTFSHRVWACLWWMMCFFLAIAYVSHLSASLLQTRRSITTTHSIKKSQEVIQDALEKGKPDLGTLIAGSTNQFFMNSSIGMYERYGRYMEKNPDVLTRTYAEGAKRVRESDGAYAFIMESPSSDFYANTQPCDLFVSASYLTTKTHAIALPKNSNNKDMIDHGVLLLLESGTLRMLYEKWWHTYSFNCEDPNMDILTKVYNKSLRLHEVSGAFYILIIITLVSLAAAAIEKYTSAKKITLD